MNTHNTADDKMHGFMLCIQLLIAYSEVHFVVFVQR